MTVSPYVACVRKYLPRPSDVQIDAFIEYFALAHSWYKHLPLLPPGEPFLFYLNPQAGREWIWTEKGGTYRDRTAATPESERFHYTWRPTRDYIERFGYLDYFTEAGTAFLVPMREGVLDTCVPPRIQAPAGGWIALPDDVRAAGAACVTAAIHRLGQEPLLWLGRVGKLRTPTWGEPDTVLPEQGPDDEITATIVELIRSVPDPGAPWPSLWHSVLKVLRSTRPIETRVLDLPACEDFKTRWLPVYGTQQRLQIGRAIRRMLECVYDRRTGPSPGAA
jgi:hypothetical protein